jgi:hypothetical protein
MSIEVMVRFFIGLELKVESEAELEVEVVFDHDSNLTTCPGADPESFLRGCGTV